MLHRSNAVLRRTIALAAATLTVVACHDAAGPDRSTRIDVVLARLDGPAIGSDAQRNLTIECDPYLRAVVTGQGVASWRDATIRWFWGPDRTRAVDSSTISASDVLDSWGGGAIAPPDTLTSALAFTAAVPFAAEIVYQYKPLDAGVRRDSVRFNCGPNIPPGTPGPTITVPNTNATSGKVQPGDTLRVSYTATAAATLWQLVVQLSGACTAQEEFSAGLALSVTRTDSIVVPRGCELGQPLDVTVYAVDAGGRIASASRDPKLAVVDTVPPTLAPVLTSPWNAVSASAFSGTLFTGDTLRVSFGSRDNNAVSMLYWEETATGARDSSWAPLGDQARIVMRPEWAGQALHFRFWVTDRAGLASDTVATTPGSITVAPIAPRPVTTAQLAGEVRDIAYDGARQLVYFAEHSPDRIAVFSLGSMTVIDSMALPEMPASIDLTPSGDSLIAALINQRALAVLDLRAVTPVVTTTRLTALDTMPTPESPGSVRVLANGEALVGLNLASATVPTVLEVDLTTGAQQLRPDAQRNGAQAYAVGRSADGSVVVMNEGCFQRYTAATDSFTPCASTNATQSKPAVNATGSVIALGYYIYDGSLALQRIMQPLYPLNPQYYDPGTALSPDGSALYAIDWSVGVVRYRTSDGVVLDAIPNAQLQPSRIVATPDGRWLITVRSSTTSAISVIDMQ